MAMTIDRIFLAFMAACGAAIGILLVLAPEARNFVIPPYFWVLIAMALFEGAVLAVRRGTPGAMLSIEMRFIGFGIGIALMILIPVVMGSPGRLF